MKFTQIPYYSFYYFLPLTLGLFTGIAFRDSQTLSVKKKISMSTAEYYEKIGEEVHIDIAGAFPDVERLLKRVNKKRENMRLIDDTPNNNKF